MTPRSTATSRPRSPPPRAASRAAPTARSSSTTTCRRSALKLAQTTVSEAAGANATTGTVSIASPATEPLTIVLGSSLTSAATVPKSVVIDAGQVSASFPIAALNSGLDVRNQTAVITANVETYAGVVVTQGSAEASLLLLNANGPALTLSFATPTVAEGSTVTATVTRNTDTTDALVVTLASTDPTAASVPATVTIPAGQASVTFTVDAVQNGVPEGMQQVQISATTAGLDTGLATLGITDVQLPDLVVSSVTAPASGYDNTPLSISWTVTNSGDYPATGSWVDEVFLDPAGGPESTTPVDCAHVYGHAQPRPELHADRHDSIPLIRRPVLRARRDRQRRQRAGAELHQ